MATKDPKANAEHQRAWRERQRGGPPRELAPHGTHAAIARHKRAKEPLCDECATYNRAYQSEQYRKRKAKTAKRSGLETD